MLWNAFEQKKKKPELKLNPGLVLIGLQTTGSRSVLSGLKTRGEAESFYTWKYMIASFLSGFKISDIDELILALMFRTGVILV